ncbi:SDR family NAD(P)-dependent oxidoreductase [Enterovirga sp. CN4-39]|uniref:SDR family NAD(P)-dependent oxidoreductase n=1 Tax=Enterovirga sp. CN4-39 TaxID=3400910 RepID=UPI003BFE42A9
MFSIDDKVVLVTGASSGIGLHLAGMLAGRGARVVAVSRRATESSALAALGGDVHPIDLDVTQPESIAGAVATVRSAFGRIDVLLNNAGSVTPKRVLDTTPEDWDRVLETNLSGPFLMSRAAAPLMPPGGSIINIASIGAFKAIVGLAAYAASKSGLLLLSRSLALEFAEREIRVNVVAPGYIRTPMNDGFLDGPEGDRLKSRIPLKRFGDPSDLDGAIVYLSSDASRYMTGGTLIVDGGFLL